MCLYVYGCVCVCARTRASVYWSLFGLYLYVIQYVIIYVSLTHVIYVKPSVKLKPKGNPGTKIPSLDP